MNAILTNLSELIKLVTDSFRLPAIFPALFFVLLNRFFIAPYFEHLPLVSQISQQGLWDQLFILSLLAFLIGYTINALEVPIIKLYEGYPWWDTRLGRLFTHRKQNRLRWLKNQIKELENDNITRIKYQLEVDQFPLDEARVLPTKLGNLIAAFEAYPGSRYGMDGVTFWPRLYPILDKEGFLPYITQARSTLDFLLNTSLLMAIFGFECLLLRIFFLSHISGMLPLLAFAASLIFYVAAASSVHDWGAMSQVAFDLFRYHLAHALGLKTVGSFTEEMRQWRSLTEFWQSNQNFEGFNHIRNWPVEVTKKEG